MDTAITAYLICEDGDGFSRSWTVVEAGEQLPVAAVSLRALHAIVAALWVLTVALIVLLARAV